MNRALLLLVAAPVLLAAGAPAEAAVPPTKPANFRALPASNTTVRLFWLDTAGDETGFRIERGQNGVFQFVKNVGRNVQLTSIGGLVENQYYQFRIRSFGPTGTSQFALTGAYTDDHITPGPCIPTASAICLGPTNRFRVEARFKINNNVIEPAGGEEIRQDAGIFYFVNPDNVEILVKVLNACFTHSPRYWIFYSGLTNAEYTLTVTDTQAGRTRTYVNPVGNRHPPIQDTNAFATCP